jgi:hypothetical protein
MWSEGYPVRRTSIVCALLLLLPAAGGAQRPDVDDVVRRLGDYIVSYESRLATVVAEEAYVQTLTAAGPRQQRRLTSDYVLTLASDRGTWVGFRDTFEVDGTAVRERDSRLQRLMSSGALSQAARIAAENSRYNLANDVVTRNVNVPTFALEVLHPRNHRRLTFRRAATQVPDYPGTLDLEFRERERPTMVRRPDGRDNPMRGTLRVVTSTGEVTHTRVTWEALDGSVAVTYGRVEDIDVAVPLTMSEIFRRGDTTINAEATYSNHRQFRTSSRLITP